MLLYVQRKLFLKTSLNFHFFSFKMVLVTGCWLLFLLTPYFLLLHSPLISHLSPLLFFHSKFYILPKSYEFRVTSYEFTHFSSLTSSSILHTSYFLLLFLPYSTTHLTQLLNFLPTTCTSGSWFPEPV